MEQEIKDIVKKYKLNEVKSFKGIHDKEAIVFNIGTHLVFHVYDKIFAGDLMKVLLWLANEVDKDDVEEVKHINPGKPLFDQTSEHDVEKLVAEYRDQERILTITEELGNGDGGSCGYVITTTKQVITIMIADYQNCCESYGYMCVCDEKPEYFHGAILKGISLVTTDDPNAPKIYTKQSLELLSSVDMGGVIQVDIETDRGVLSLAVYNMHNGYYGHSVSIKSKQVSYEGRL